MVVREPRKIPRSRNTAFPSASFAGCQLPERKVGNQERGKDDGEGRMRQTLNPGNVGDKLKPDQSGGPEPSTGDT